ncbi:hypothetical protein [Lysinibacter cavernae]|uniref:SRPBCC family protein n=1 Tax=Lysinibacter cavernae TaxID=1640652 RepID=A0A7X5R2A3_9MICO|nr:hypothetical protein [Lysinibacter cavernae]NIH54363.1 hypothetical protein [Lysinibacter cavernae]
MSREYGFVTEWELNASRDRVWRAVATGPAENLTPWWRGVTLSVGPAGLIEGAVAQLSVVSPVGYTLRERLVVAVVEAPKLLVATSAGDLVGEGRVELMPVDGNHTRVRVTWCVVATRRWMVVSAWFLDPLFRWAHRRVMARGLVGLRQLVANTDDE